MKRPVAKIVKDLDRHIQSLGEALLEVTDDPAEFERRIKKFKKKLKDSGLEKEIKDIEIGPQINGEATFYRKKR